MIAGILWTIILLAFAVAIVFMLVVLRFFVAMSGWSNSRNELFILCGCIVCFLTILYHPEAVKWLVDSTHHFLPPNPAEVFSK